MKKTSLIIPLIILSLQQTGFAQHTKVEVVSDKHDPIIRVMIGGKHFTSFFFPDTIA